MVAVNSVIDIEYNHWYNVVATRSNNTLELFVDGESVGQGTFSEDITLSGSEIHISVDGGMVQVDLRNPIIFKGLWIMYLLGPSTNSGKYSNLFR